MVADNEDDCFLCDSGIRFGINCFPDDSIKCGNFDSTDNGGANIRAMGFI